ncbi:MAG: GHKL domain-containing protein [Oscillospiraceae bacterium]|nr:GHKL domain-containing protein [Oscillospiraceae bacterium]
MLWTALGYWQFDGRSLGLLLWSLAGVMTAAALVTALVEAVRRETTRRTEARLLVQRGELARSSYEALRRQNEQVMMLRHDMMKHFRLLRQTTTDEKTAAYLDELIGENEKIRPVVQSGNEMLDVILNGKLSAAADAGIAVELVRTKAPDKLPLTDAELCSLMMNLLDNAVEAAAVPGVKRRYIKLDMHIRNSFFVFACENGATLEWINKETAPERGLGLRVMRQIVERYGNLCKTEYGDDYYKVTVLIPLHQPLK